MLQALVLAVLTVVGTLSSPANPARAATSAMDALAGPPAAGDLDVMTFNLRYASTTTPNSWAQRRPVLRAVLTTEQPDLIGTQEGLVAQLRDIETDLGTRYDYIGQGREGGTRGEFMAVFYDNTRLTPQTYGHFWLSDTPEVPGSNTWGAGSIRMVTWVRFLDQATGTRFYAVNTHLDNVSEYARRRAAQLIRDRLAGFTPVLPIVLTGDFNTPAQAGGYVYDLLVNQAGYRDTWATAQLRGPVYGTYHGYQPLVPNGPRIDWVLATPGVTTRGALINTYRGGAQYPSDHLPVQARVRLP
ncbi:endonuclease/exonuclease/phosphatase family protein [Actinomycetes bacterium KLBMP 9797]